MGTREALRRHEGVDNDDIDDIIGIAQELQNARDDAESRATVEEIEAVADDLDIDPALVEEAIAVLQRRREEAAEAARLEAAEAAASRARWARLGLIGGGGLAAVAAGVLILVVGMAWSGSVAIDQAEAQVSSAERALDVVLERQASLVPQLVALSGGDSSGLDSLAAAVKGAATTDERLAASERLGEALVGRLGAMSSDDAGASAQQRLDLQHEIVGAQNRITTERRRVEEARAALAEAEASMTGGLARTLGL